MNAKRLTRASSALIAVIAIICSQPSPLAALAAAIIPETATNISELAWISGDWQTAPGGRAQIEEHWTEPSGGSMIGMGRTTAGGRTVEFEYLRIEQRADQIYYVANPKGRCPATDFKLTRLSGQEAIFENPEHDFPKRVIYRKNTDGSLTASIDGGPGTKSVSFAYLPMAK